MSFRQLIGHRRLLELLARAVARETLPPSLLFAGPVGVGKFASAAALAEVLNCESPVRPGEDLVASSFELDACDACRSCRRLVRAVEALAHGEEAALDCLRVLKPDERGSIKTDPVRDLIATTAFRPFDGRRRVVVLDTADALEVPAQNALLKVLEEPPAGTVFVLVTARPDALLPTVRSRCPRLRFGPLSDDDIVDYLVRERGVSQVDARAQVAEADGSLGLALEIGSVGALEAREVASAVLEQIASDDAPASRLAAAQTLIGKAAVGTARKSATAATRAQISTRLQALSRMLRDMQVVSSRADDRWLAHHDLAPALARLAGAFDGQRVSRAFTAVDRAQFALERNVSHKAVADWLAFEL
jgi:DNA polymerase-3 subunit delta'